jgi:hypothetical protein
MMAAETSSEMINSVQSGLAVHQLPDELLHKPQHSSLGRRFKYARPNPVSSSTSLTRASHLP